MKRDDVIQRGAWERARPALNIKHHYWLPELIKLWQNEGHEFSGDAEFWAWCDDLVSHSNWEVAQPAEDFANEDGWEQADETANDVWPSPRVKVYSDGCSYGWLIVEGLSPVEEWDAIALGRWRKFAKQIRAILGERDYQFVWHLYVNVYEPLREQGIERAKVLVRS